MNNPSFPEPFKLIRVRKEFSEVKSLEIIPLNGRFSFQAGQFNMLYLFGIGEVPISISSHPKISEKKITHTIRSVGLVTQALCQLKSGTVLGVRGPFGSSWPLSNYKGKDLLFIAGGLGLAPIRPAILEALDQRDQFGRVILLYGTRTSDTLLFQYDLLKWQNRFDLEVFITVDRADSSWKGIVGVIPLFIPRLKIHPVNTIAFMCGPEIMMRFTIKQLLQVGLSSHQIYLSMERNMRCATGFCGHCQFGSKFICKDGPILRLSSIETFLKVKEL